MCLVVQVNATDVYMLETQLEGVNKLNITTGELVRKPPMITEHSSACHVGNILYCMGGNLNICDTYNIITEKWQR